MKLVRVDVAREVIGGFVREQPDGWWVRPHRGSALPSDAELVWMYLSADGRTLSLVFTHKSFPDVEEGAPIPPRSVTIEWVGEAVKEDAS